LPTTFSSKAECVSTYSECMQDLALCFRAQLAYDLSICDVFQDKCEAIYSSCRYFQMPLPSATHQQSEIKECMGRYDTCLDMQETCEKLNSTANCVDITAECDDILRSCHNPGDVARPRPTGTALENYIATWTAPETILPVYPTPIINEHCHLTYQHCATFYTACIASSPIDAFDAEHHAKACYQILLRCKSQLTSCSGSPLAPLATWIPEAIAQGVDVPAWAPEVATTDDNGICLAGYQKCLILYRNCLMVATQMQDAGWFEKAEIHRNGCQEQIVPLCIKGVAICDGLRQI
jgi:hypothetical protein